MVWVVLYLGMLLGTLLAVGLLGFSRQRKDRGHQTGIVRTWCTGFSRTLIFCKTIFVGRGFQSKSAQVIHSLATRLSPQEMQNPPCSPFSKGGF